MVKIFSQRGAMFGLDARIALAIFAGLSIVVGASMVQIMKDNRAEKILLEREKVASAVDALQEDIGTYLYSEITTQNWGNLYRSLTRADVFNAATQPKWRGPYLDDEYSSILHKTYSRIRMRAMPTAADIRNCTTPEIRSRQCSYFLVLGWPTEPVPTEVIDAVNERLDGAGEATPETNGKVRTDGALLLIELTTVLN